MKKMLIYSTDWPFSLSGVSERGLNTSLNPIQSGTYYCHSLSLKCQHYRFWPKRKGPKLPPLELTFKPFFICVQPQFDCATTKSSQQLVIMQNISVVATAPVCYLL